MEVLLTVFFRVGWGWYGSVWIFFELWELKKLANFRLVLKFARQFQSILKIGTYIDRSVWVGVPGTVQDTLLSVVKHYRNLFWFTAKI